MEIDFIEDIEKLKKIGLSYQNESFFKQIKKDIETVIKKVTNLNIVRFEIKENTKFELVVNNPKGIFNTKGISKLKGNKYLVRKTKYDFLQFDEYIPMLFPLENVNDKYNTVVYIKMINTNKKNTYEIKFIIRYIMSNIFNLYIDFTPEENPYICAIFKNDSRIDKELKRNCETGNDATLFFNLYSKFIDESENNKKRKQKLKEQIKNIYNNKELKILDYRCDYRIFDIIKRILNDSITGEI